MAIDPFYQDTENKILDILKELSARNGTTQYPNPYHKDSVKTQIEYIRKQLAEFNHSLEAEKNEYQAKARWLKQVSYLLNQMHVTVLFSPYFLLTDEEIVANRALIETLNAQMASLQEEPQVLSSKINEDGTPKFEIDDAQESEPTLTSPAIIKAPKTEAVQLIELGENLIGQNRLVSASHYYFNNAQGYIPDFYQIVNDYHQLRILASELRDSEKKLALLKLQDRINDFFGKNGMNFEWSVFESGTFPPDNLLKDNLHLQTLLYFKAYLYSHFCFTQEGELDLKQNSSIDLYSGAANAICDKLKALSFSPAVNLKAMLETDERDVKQQISDGAQLGSVLCQAKMGQLYLGHLVNTLSANTPETFSFPPDINEDMVIQWLIEARDRGNIDALSFIGNFAANYFSSAGALYQEITAEQKERLDKIAEVLTKISGDNIVNNFVREVTSIKTEGKENNLIIREFKDIRDNAIKHVIQDYSRPYLEDKESMRAKLSSINIDKLPHYDQSFAILQIKELNEQTSKIKTSLENEKQRLVGRINEKWIGNKDRQQRIAAIDNCLQALTKVSQDAQNQLRTKKYNTATLFTSFGESITTLQNDLSPKSTLSRFKRFINKHVFAKSFNDKTVENMDPIIKEVKGALNNIPLLIDPNAQERYQKLVDIIIDRASQGDIDAIKAAMAQPYFDVNMKSPNGDNLLLAAIRSGKSDIVKLVLTQKDLDLTVSGQRNDNALTCALTMGDMETVKAITTYAEENNQDLAYLINLKDRKGDTPLDAAIIAGNAIAVKYLLEFEETDVNLQTSGKSTPLTTAILCKQFDILRILLNHPKIEIEKPGFQDKTPMQTALKHNRMGMARLLEQFGAKKLDVDVGLANFAGEAQSSHRDEVHASTAKAIKKLKERYQEIDIDKNLKEIEEFINALPSSDAYLDENMVAKRSFARMLALEAKEKITKTDLKEVLALAWQGLTDIEHIKDREAAKRALVKNFALAQREYNLNKEGIDNGKEDSVACNDGTINKVIETLDRIHPDVEIIYDAKGLCGTLAKEISQKLFDDLDEEEQRRIATLLEEHPLDQNTLPDDPFFTELKSAVEAGIRKQFGILPDEEDGIISLNDVVVIQNNLRWMDFKLKEPKEELITTPENEAPASAAIQEPNVMQKRTFEQIYKNKNEDFEATIEFLQTKMKYLNLQPEQIEWFRKEKGVEKKVSIEEPNNMQKRSFGEIYKNKNEDFEATVEFIQSKMKFLNLKPEHIEWFRKEKEIAPPAQNESKRKSLLYAKDKHDIASQDSTEKPIRPEVSSEPGPSRSRKMRDE